VTDAEDVFSRWVQGDDEKIVVKQDNAYVQRINDRLCIFLQCTVTARAGRALWVFVV